MTKEYKYDNAGNLLEDGRARYEYDAFNRNTRVETFDGNVQVNRYDAEGLRHEMEENGELVSFIFRDREVVAEEGQAGRIRYIRTGELLASDAEYARTYYHYASDEMGSITHVVAGEGKGSVSAGQNKEAALAGQGNEPALTGYGNEPASTGQGNGSAESGGFPKNSILNRYEYDAWGNVSVCEETVRNRFKFNGQQYDPVSQQYYLRARYYNPVTGRFTQEDTYRGDGLNLYVYCRSNPVYYVDPSGHVICERRAATLMDKISSGGEGSLTAGQQRQLTLFLREKVTKDPASLSPAEHNALSTMDPRFYNDHVANPGQGSRNPVNVDGYYFMRHNDNVTGQVHHLNQDAAFGSVIPKEDGLCVELHGNAFSDEGTQHYDAHNRMEQFWNQYRDGGEFAGTHPTVGQYNRALQDSLVHAGFTQEQARFAVEQAAAQQRHYGLTDASPVPRVPNEIHQSHQRK